MTPQTRRAPAAATAAAMLEARAENRLKHEHYRRLLPLVRRAAMRFAGRVPNARFGDVAAWAWLGVLDAFERTTGDLDPDEIERYALYRMNGALLDGLIAGDATAAAARALSLRVSDVIRALVARLGRSPEREEIARELGMSVEAYADALLELGARGMTRLELSRRGAPQRPEPVDAAPLRDAVARALDTLPERVLDLFVLHYEEKLTLREAAPYLGLDERAAMALHVEAIHRLRAALGTGSEERPAPCPVAPLPRAA